MKNLFFILFIVGFVGFVVSCGVGNKPTYEVTTTVSPTEGGAIALSPSGGVYSEDEVVTMTGTPSNGWRFVRWEGDLSSTQNSSTITMNKNYSVVGVFEKKNYPLTINIEGFGEVEEREIQQKTTEYLFQTVVELTPVPDVGWEFVEWSGDLSGNEVPKQITVDGEKTVTAKFERKNYPLTINIVGEGTVKETVLPQKTTEYPFETVVILEPEPSEGWFFWNYRGDLSGNENPQMIIADEDKNVTITFIRKGTIDELYLYSYDSNNKLIDILGYNSDGSISFRLTGSYDINNNLIEVIEYDSDGSISFRTTNSYDINNNLIERIGYNSDGSISYRDTYFYDSNNNLIERIEYNPDGSIFYRDTYFYDSNNNLIETIGYDSNGIFLLRWTSSYDSNNNLIEVIGYNSDGSIFDRRTYSYDINNNLIETIGYNSDGSISYRDTYSYDLNNNLIEENWYSPDGSIFYRFTYSYDLNNNLIESFGYALVSNKSNSTIQIDPFNDFERYKIRPYDELTLYPRPRPKSITHP
jgi:hypothetical protein